MKFLEKIPPASESRLTRGMTGIKERCANACDWLLWKTGIREETAQDKAFREFVIAAIEAAERAAKRAAYMHLARHKNEK